MRRLFVSDSDVSDKCHIVNNLLDGVLEYQNKLLALNR